MASIMVEGKVSEPFGETIAEWMEKENNSEGKQERLKFLLDKLQLRNDQINAIRYQFLHRTASAVIQAERFKAENALMLVHSLSQANKGFDDYCQFLALFGSKGKINSLVFAKSIHGIDLYFGWIKGDEKYLANEQLTTSGCVFAGSFAYPNAFGISQTCKPLSETESEE